ncbi:aryl-alcohol dehydrogenase-like predicted oxidoreductase [Arcanobacterium pluranimalium]|uniref:aldo/keto reductase n=1 Tax=Arcanobacterium pluranimalium TaxID=108028 RepID=UPI001958BFDB|nr:aryl-alcohol dehydrogenase-like predicted oxidoreductase [Arcanobacterium pluranimalium]
MKHTKLGKSGLTVGAIGLGTLTWGRDTEIHDAQRMLTALLDAGGNLIDVSPIYAQGNAENTIGELFTAGFHREDFVIMAHVGERPTPGGIMRNNGRSSLISSLHRTLTTLHTDYVDVVMLACPDWSTPFEETIGTLAQFVIDGKARYLGFAHCPAWYVAKAAQYLQDLHLPVPIALGTQYSLLERQAEFELFPMAEDCGLGIAAYAPLAAGALTGKYRNTIPPTSRAATTHLSATVEPYLDDAPRRITEAIIKAADGLGRTPADIALTWALQHNVVAAALCGARTASQADQLFAMDMSDLPQQVIDVLNEISALELTYPQ